MPPPFYWLPVPLRSDCSPGPALALLTAYSAMCRRPLWCNVPPRWEERSRLGYALSAVYSAMYRRSLWCGVSPGWEERSLLCILSPVSERIYVTLLHLSFILMARPRRLSCTAAL